MAKGLHKDILEKENPTIQVLSLVEKESKSSIGSISKIIISNWSRKCWEE